MRARNFNHKKIPRLPLEEIAKIRYERLRSGSSCLVYISYVSRVDGVVYFHGFPIRTSVMKGKKTGMNEPQLWEYITTRQIIQCTTMELLLLEGLAQGWARGGRKWKGAIWECKYTPTYYSVFIALLLQIPIHIWTTAHMFPALTCEMMRLNACRSEDRVCEYRSHTSENCPVICQLDYSFNDWQS